MEKTTWEQAEEFAVEVIREARKKAKFWFAAWLVTFVVLITVVTAVLVM
jgi:t-SNARE complex subunit (syntaxin)